MIVTEIERADWQSNAYGDDRQPIVADRCEFCGDWHDDHLARCIGGDCRPEWNWRRLDCPVHGERPAAAAA